MRAPEVVVVAALARNGVIGASGTIPWHLSADLRRFKAITSGHPVVMGRVTHESIGRALPDRTNIVLTSDPAWEAHGCARAADLASALALGAGASGGEVVFVIGGGAVYAEALPIAHRLELTHVDLEPEGDTHFPPFDADGWQVVSSERRQADEDHAVGFEFVTYLRR